MTKLPQRAGILCNDPEFRRFAATRCGILNREFGTEATAVYLRQQCGIKSRRELADDPDAQHRFDQLQTEFDSWRGRIAHRR